MTQQNESSNAETLAREWLNAYAKAQYGAVGGLFGYKTVLRILAAYAAPLRERIAELERERDAARNELVNAQREAHAIRRNYLHEKARAEAAEAKWVCSRHVNLLSSLVPPTHCFACESAEHQAEVQRLGEKLEAASIVADKLNQDIQQLYLRHREGR